MKSSKLLLIVIFTQDWCISCAENARYVLLYLNIRLKVGLDLIIFQIKTLKRRGYKADVVVILCCNQNSLGLAVVGIDPVHIVCNIWNYILYRYMRISKNLLEESCAWPVGYEELLEVIRTQNHKARILVNFWWGSPELLMRSTYAI